jgi:NAD(P)-dependent dehydrogenase (short-subunit alcohol dehydrogenase family)
VAIVAGAGGARGHATAATLAAGGRSVVAAGRNEQDRGQFPDGLRLPVEHHPDAAS